MCASEPGTCTDGAGGPGPGRRERHGRLRAKVAKMSKARYVGLAFFVAAGRSRRP